MRYTLYNPQEHVINLLRDEFIKDKKRVLIQAPTGFGKTILSYHIIHNAISKGNKVLFTCHRIQLAEQSRDKFKDFNPNFVQSSNTIDNGSKLTVATLQTLLKKEVETPNIIIIDEVHFGFDSKLIKSIFEKFPDAYYIGLSATPVDDGGYLLEGFDAIIDKYQTQDMIDMELLVPFAIFSPVHIDLSQARVKNDEYIQDDIENIVNKDDINKSIVDNYQILGRQRKFIVFCVNKKHCFDLQKHFHARHIRVGVIVADTTDIEREIIFSDYSNGVIQGILNVEILTAGYDDPTIGCVIFACPTKSWKKFIQCAGRGIRKLEGKTDCILLDCANVIEEHGLPTDRKKLYFRNKISKVIDRELDLDEIEERSKIDAYSQEKLVVLRKIGSLLDIYDGKEYQKESELQADCNNFLDKYQCYGWRQNSGIMKEGDRWIHFTSKKGLPDATVFYRNTSLYFGIELKLKHGRLTEHQQRTLPEFIQNDILFFICESIYDVYRAIIHIESNIVLTDDEFIVKKTIYQYPDWQIDIRNKLKLFARI